MYSGIIDTKYQTELILLLLIGLLLLHLCDQLFLYNSNYDINSKAQKCYKL